MAVRQLRSRNVSQTRQVRAIEQIRKNSALCNVVLDQDAIDVKVVGLRLKVSQHQNPTHEQQGHC